MYQDLDLIVSVVEFSVDLSTNDTKILTLKFGQVALGFKPK